MSSLTAMRRASLPLASSLSFIPSSPSQKRAMEEEISCRVALFFCEPVPSSSSVATFMSEASDISVAFKAASSPPRYWSRSAVSWYSLATTSDMLDSVLKPCASFFAYATADLNAGPSSSKNCLPSIFDTIDFAPSPIFEKNFFMDDTADLAPCFILEVWKSSYGMVKNSTRTGWHVISFLILKFAVEVSRGETKSLPKKRSSTLLLISTYSGSFSRPAVSKELVFSGRAGRERKGKASNRRSRSLTKSLNLLRTLNSVPPYSSSRVRVSIR
mmetsp:Transcript_34223/g.88399  ORF Transcript_34223/g.88399 Transcript_34223/m.88399 type:complete len:272 (+) Transcript_34223:830-1645(+)